MADNAPNPPYFNEERRFDYFKRRTNIKDTGKIIPGHGGLLDRIDGMIFVFPFSYIINLTSIFNL